MPANPTSAQGLLLTMLVLGIESSCDDTGVALYDGTRGLLGHLLHSQTALHAPFGGVVPELASRDHLRRLVPLLDALLLQCNCRIDDIQGIAYTAGPGLVGALLVGGAFARSFAWARQIPAIGVHHMEAHLLAPLINDGDRPSGPFVALLVSGGHTQLVRVAAVGQYEMLGESIDDAAGEAFDKTAKLLGLGYPGGPEIARLAETGDASRFRLPRPMLNRPSLDFSFSGLKTAVLHQLRALEAAGPVSQIDRADLAASFQAAVVDTLLGKCLQAMQRTGLTQLVIAGGVSANRELRARLTTALAAGGMQLFCPPLSLCTDNGAMVAYAGYLRLAAGQLDDLNIRALPRWSLTALPPIETVGALAL